MITCRELIDFLDDYVEDRMEISRKRAFEEHLAVCPDCVNYLSSYRATINAVQACFDGPGAPPPEEVPEDLITAILDARSKT